MKTKDAVAALDALAQETRLAVFRVLVQQGPSGMAAGEIASTLRLSPATLSFHLKELNHAGLVASRQQGRFVYYAAEFGTMNRLLDFLTANCCAADNVPCKPGQSCAPAVKPKRAPEAVARRRKGVTP